jgi:hypothetical protein
MWRHGLCPVLKIFWDDTEIVPQVEIFGTCARGLFQAVKFRLR